MASPFKISIPDSELELLQRKLQDTRLPTDADSAGWGEGNGVTSKLISSTIDYWKNEYSWRAVEAEINGALPQYTVPIDAGDFGTLSIHFVHSRAAEATADAIPLLFLHGWPGSFLEVRKVLPLLNEAGFHVVAPSLPGYGFSSYPSGAGFKIPHTAAVMHQLMQKLGYVDYVVQGGDWGSIVARYVALGFPEHAKALHQNMLIMFAPPAELGTAAAPEYTAQELDGMQRLKEFGDKGTAYQMVQSTRPRTLGFAMHDSPVGMLAWMADKLLQWADDYPWSPEELVTWTLLHYWPGPTTGFVMYRENLPDRNSKQLPPKTYVKQPMGASIFPGEMATIPRSWEETESNVQFWRVHDRGGHFAAWEKPDELAADLIEFFKQHWRGGQ